MGIPNDDYSEIIREKKAQISQSQLSNEDEELKQEMLDLVELLKSNDKETHETALQKLKKHCQTGSSSLTLLPKYLQFLFDKITVLKEIHAKWGPDYPPTKELSLIISALSILTTDDNDCLAYRYMGPKNDDLSKWGLEYIRHLAEELKSDLESKLSKTNYPANEAALDEAIPLLCQITDYYMLNNCEIDAVDLYIDLDYHERLEMFLNPANVLKICRYLQQCTSFFLKEEYLEMNRFLSGIYARFNFVFETFISACRNLDVEFFHEILLKVVDDPSHFSIDPANAEHVQTQLCHILGHYGIYYCFSEEHESETRCKVDDLLQVIQNRGLSAAHADLAIEFDIMKPYAIEDICRIGNQKYSSYYNSANLKDPIYTCLASAFVSGFANAAYKTDQFLLIDQHHKWLLTQSDTALMTCVAAIGLLYMWDVDEAFLVLDRFLDSSNVHIKAGGLLALGVASANVIDPFMSQFALLNDYLEDEELVLRRNAVMGLGLAYVGTDDQDVVDVLKEIFMLRNNDYQMKAVTSLAIGMVACGGNTPHVISDFIGNYLESNRDSLSINDPFLRLIPVGLALCYVGRYEPIQQTTKDLAKLPGDFGKWCFILIKICANIGTGNCVTLQKLIEYIHEPQKIASDMQTQSPTDVDLSGQKTDLLGNVDISDLQQLEKLMEMSTKLELKNTGLENEVAETIDTRSDQPTVEGEKKTEEIKDEPEVQKEQKRSTKGASENKKIEMKKIKEELRATELLQGLAVVGVAFVSIIEEISQKMAFKLFNTFLQFGSIGVRRAVPVALGILSASNPQINIIELLSKLSHDHDDVVSLNAILALGIVGAGTNNSRIGNLLRNLNIFHHNEPLHVFAIRISQGLLFLSKGVMSLTPLRAEGTFLTPVGLASLFLHGVLSLDVKNTYLSKDPHMLFWLVPAMKLRALITYDENNRSVPVTVRVGQAVDETGQAGKPKRITGFQTHRTPILLNVGERVELATNKYIPYSPILEGIVLVRENPNASGPDLC